MRHNEIKKLSLRIFYVGLMLCSLNVPSQAGKYTDAFEREINWQGRCRNLGCKIQQTTYTATKEVEVGRSVGPLGTTKHYGKVPITWTNGWGSCIRCGRSGDAAASPPSFEFEQKGKTRLMRKKVDKKYFSSSKSSTHVCEKPNLDGELAVIWKEAGGNHHWMWEWDSALYRMWETAKRLDGVVENPWAEESEEILPEESSIKEKSSGCCTIQ